MLQYLRDKPLRFTEVVDRKKLFEEILAFVEKYKFCVSARNLEQKPFEIGRNEDIH